MKLELLNATISLNSLRIPLGGRAGKNSIRIIDQWRICFTWQDDNAHDVEIVNYQ